MLVTFKSNAPHADVTMFGTAATTLLKMMGLSGNVPGAIMPEDIDAALQALREALAAQAPEEASAVEPDDGADRSEADDDETRQTPVALSQRAAPLIALLEAGRAADASVLWNE